MVSVSIPFQFRNLIKVEIVDTRDLSADPEVHKTCALASPKPRIHGIPCSPKWMIARQPGRAFNIDTSQTTDLLSQLLQRAGFWEMDLFCDQSFVPTGTDDIRYHHRRPVPPAPQCHDERSFTDHIFVEQEIDDTVADRYRVEILATGVKGAGASYLERSTWRQFEAALPGVNFVGDLAQRVNGCEVMQNVLGARCCSA